MAAQNFISLGINTQQFDDDKAILMGKIEKMYKEIEEYSKRNITPTLGVGLTEFNNSIKTTTALLDGLSSRLNTISNNQNASSSSTSRATTSAKTLNKELEKTSAIQDRINKSLGIGRTSMTGYREEADKVARSLKVVAAEQDKTAAATAKAKAVADKAATKDARDLKAQQLRDQRKKDTADRQQQAKDDKQHQKDLKEEAAEVERLSNKYKVLSQELKEVGDAYANSSLDKGKNAPETKALLAEYTERAKVLNDINGKLQDAGGGAKLFGGALATVFSHLRTIAYVLPGLGIAGIFNLAFEAIGKAADELGIFNSKLIDANERETKFNELITEQLDILKGITEQRLKLISLTSDDSASGLQAGIDIETAKGVNDLAIGLHNIAKAQTEYNDARAKLPPGQRIGDIESDINKSIKLQSELAKINTELDKLVNAKDTETLGEKLGAITDIINTAPLAIFSKKSRAVIGQEVQKLRQKQVDDKFTGYTQEELESFSALVKSQLKAAETVNQEKLKNLQDYSQKEIQVRVATQEQVKKINDAERSLELARLQDEVSYNNEKNEKILSDDIASEKKRINALYKLKVNAEKLINKELQNVERNESSTEYQKAEARSKAQTAVKRAQLEYDTKVDNLIEENRQKRLTATLAIESDIVEKTAIANEKVFNNDNKTLSQRLVAFSDYIDEKQKLQDMQLKRELDQQKYAAKNDPTVKKLIQEQRSASDLQKANIQADVEKRVYDIVVTSLQKQLNAVKDENAYENRDNLNKYTKDLEALNKSLEKKEISYRKFKEKRLKIDEEYRVKILDNDIKDGEEDIERLKKVLKEQEEFLLKQRANLAAARENQANVAATGGDNLAANQEVDTAVGEVKGAIQVISNTSAEIEKKEKELDENKNKRAKTRLDSLKKFYFDYYQDIAKLANAVVNVMKAESDAMYQREFEQLARKKEMIAQVYGSELEAIDKSSLSAKEKFALDKQLNAQKLQIEKNAAAQERKLKRDQAIADRQFALFHIAINTAEGISKAFATLQPPANFIQAGITAGVGLAEAAVVASKPIPYKKGTPPGGHKGGLAMYGEDGAELVKEPYKSPYLVMDKMVSYLPKGTEVIPLTESPEFSARSDDSWAQTKYLARQIAKNKKEINNTFSPRITIDLGTELWKRQILGN